MTFQLKENLKEELSEKAAAGQSIQMCFFAIVFKYLNVFH
jgi:hypothetical protein